MLKMVMRIVFYHVASNKFDGKKNGFGYNPTCAEQWQRVAEMYNECEIVLVATVPGFTILDINENGVSQYAPNVKYHILTGMEEAEEVADIVAGFKPDIAIALSTHDVLFDWLSVKNGIIAEELKKKGIKTMANPTFSAIGFFDKWRSNLILRNSKLKIAQGIYIHNDLFKLDEEKYSMLKNVYKEYVLYRVKVLNYPVIIKSTFGAASIGISIADTYEHAVEILLSEDNNADLMVEELIQGVPFGTEIHGVRGRYSVLPPVVFSTNSDGITDPLRSIKYGPVLGDEYHIPELQKALVDMAEALELEGISQVDLLYSNGQWYVIEVNPRISGMTSTAAAMEGRIPYSIFIDSALGIDKNYCMKENLKYVMNFKTRLLHPEEVEKISENPNVDHIRITKSKYIENSEIVISVSENKEKLIEVLYTINKTMAESIISEETIADAIALVNKY